MVLRWFLKGFENENYYRFEVFVIISVNDFATSGYKVTCYVTDDSGNP